MVLGQPETKCAHGVYKAGEPVAKYCGFCNPNMEFSAIKSAKSEPDPSDEEVTIDCVEFMERSPGSRLAQVSLG